MDAGQKLIPKPAVKGIATGLCLMAFFTLIWAGIAFGAIYKTASAFMLLIFPLLSAWFLLYAVKLFRAAKYFPKLTTEADLAEEKRIGKWFGIIFGAEGLGIFIGINVVINLGHPELTIPTLALVVGLHFFPLAKVFKRTVDYYLATWTTLIATAAYALLLNKILPEQKVIAITGVGVALATSLYGLYMMLRGRKALSSLSESRLS